MRSVFKRLNGLGEAFLEYGGTTRGRRFLDLSKDGETLEVWAGKAHMCFSADFQGRVVTSSVLTYLGMDLLTTLMLGSRLLVPEPTEVILWWLTRRMWRGS